MKPINYKVSFKDGSIEGIELWQEGRHITVPVGEWNKVKAAVDAYALSLKETSFAPQDASVTSIVSRKRAEMTKAYLSRS